MLRVIAGSAKGHKLKCNEDIGVRPTSDKVKGAIFSIIGSEIYDTVFFDLFAGSGAVGIEALSRGARLCIFTEKNYKCAKIIENNLEKTKLKSKSKVLVKDVLLSVVEIIKQFNPDYIFLDPPYNMGFIEKVLVKFLEIEGFNSTIIIEHHPDDVEWESLQGIELLKAKAYGNTSLSFLKTASSINTASVNAYKKS